MPNLLAMSFEGEVAPTFDLRCLRRGGHVPDGWGLGYYPPGGSSAVLLKEATPAARDVTSLRGDGVGHLESHLFVLHLRKAMWGALADANTQPFSRMWG